ncbi:hypothetical protein BTZ20_0766 [Rhodococcus sp. MTM3W5.2]|uniref:hypothetical protein n=1 Tax=Rhodococcus sp. MTM3W5.2 TaxID=1805827 RepID=UPI0009792365|nr:hypothetical protein [Rhodococcus sp. MTM3W5.2]AQA26220.1 hypothetical protein BTZ20_0766 [Rhodococcus sp. MTM3W5.2]
MNARKVTQLLAATALSAAVVAGAAAPASAAPNSNPLAPITAAASSGSLGAPEGLTVDALIAARNAGFPIYEAGQTVVVSASKMGATNATEYRRVYAIDALGSPTTKFVTVGAVAPERFYTISGYGGDSIVVNMRPVENPLFQRLTYDVTPQKWLNSPLIQLPGGGPSAGIALVR